MIALYAPLNASSFLALMVVLYRWRHGTQAKHSSSNDVRRTIREGIYYDQGTGIGAISFDLARWHGGWKCPLGCSNPARRSCGGAFRSSRRTACESRGHGVVSV